MYCTQNLGHKIGGAVYDNLFFLFFFSNVKKSPSFAFIPYPFNNFYNS